MDTTTLSDVNNAAHVSLPPIDDDQPELSHDRALRWRRAAASPMRRVVHVLTEARGIERPSAERFIAQCYRRNFHAHVDAFMPRLFALRDAEDVIRGALGLRAAASGRLFVERYLDEPIESAILRFGHVCVERGSIVEVGHFAGLMPGTMRLLIALLAERLHREGIEWVAFAGTRALRNAFLRMNLVPTPVCAASPMRLSAVERASWGTYYEHGPTVYIGHVAIGVREIGPYPRSIAEISA